MSNNIKDKILDATLSVVSQETISGTRMHLIAEAADMSQANLHYHFKTKHALLLALLDKLKDDYITLREARFDKSTATLREQIHVFFQQKKELIEEHPQSDYVEMDFWIQSHTDDDIREKLVKIYEEWRNSIKLTLLRFVNTVDTASLNVIATMIVSMLEGATIQYLLDPSSMDLTFYFDTCEKIIFQFISEEEPL